MTHDASPEEPGARFDVQDVATRAGGGWKWGPFTTRIPFWHTGVSWPELLQGLFVAGATGLGLVPLLTMAFGLTFEEAVACIFLHSVLISSAPILFGEPYAPGWVTPALPLVLAFVLRGTGDETSFPTPTDKFQIMAAMSIDFAVLLFVLGITGMGRKLIEWIPPALKAGIILGAAIAALKRVFVDDAERFLWQQPVSTIVAVSVCLILTFSLPIQRLKLKHRWLAIVAGLGLLPGFAAAAFVGTFVPAPEAVQQAAREQAAAEAAAAEESTTANGVASAEEGASGEETTVVAVDTVYEIEYDVEWGLVNLPFVSFWEKASPLSIGWPTWSMYVAAFPLALMGYVILFGDLITGGEVLRAAQPDRPDEPIEIDPGRSHYSLAIRNALMAISSPFFPTQGCLWTGVHVIVVQRWREGPRSMKSLFTGLSSYYVFGIPLLYMIRPLLTGLKPLMGIALSLTLVLTGFACAYVAMGIPRTQIERGVVLLTAVSLAMFENPWVGMSIGIIATYTLVGIRSDSPSADRTPG